ncbi:MAG TPA: class I SAM-dependent methyltransferase [Gammaproteobacteria bacterium]
MRQAWAEAAAHPFDDVAATYDASFTGSALGARLRALVWERLDAALASAGRVLEIGCGTGEDAVHLARRGSDVVATDPSPAMLRVAAAKAAHAGCGGRIRFVCAPMERLGDVLAGERFDGAFSSFGAVNCVSDLERALTRLAPLLAPRAPLLLVVMGRHVPWEWAWFLARGGWREAFRRCRRDGAQWRGLRIRYPTPKELAAALAADFAPVGRWPLGLLLPPTYASAWLERRPKALAALATLERALQRCQPLAALADHYILEARRLPGTHP